MKKKKIEAKIMIKKVNYLKKQKNKRKRIQ